ncbi:MAG: sn-glycerol-1-phosphate dehydrogenase [Anaerolineales bacterium]|nr:sn-glycerol-1-phosphate dehydrogenase [Anaerolineales bacterium]
MDQSRIRQALAEASDTRLVLIAAGALASVPSAFAECFGAATAVLVADETTFDLAGRDLQARLAAAGIRTETPVVFPSRPQLYAEEANVLVLQTALEGRAAIPIAVGSGTLNDLTKLAAHRCGRPYMVVATAASMDGYTAFGAAITRDGFKQTMACPAPRALVGDLDLLATAPPAMTAAGYADLLGKVTAGADWIIADALAVEPIDRRAWSLVQDSLRAWTGDPEALRRGDRDALGQLLEGLILTGLAMQAHQTSRPASGSEHQFSHYWEMQETAHGAVSHGFKVGVGSLASAAMYERVLARDLSRIDPDTICAGWPTWAELEARIAQSHHTPALIAKAREQSLAKHLDAGALRQRLVRVQQCWPELRVELQRQLLPAEALQSLLSAVACPTTPEAIGHTRAELRHTYTAARQVRSRYTVLDLAAETGCFDAVVDELFAPGGYWGSRT